MSEPDDDETYTRDDMRAVCFAAAEHFDHEAYVARRAQASATSAALRFRMLGNADQAEAAATYMRAVGNHK